mgnify:CR=1 FL=1
MITIDCPLCAGDALADEAEGVMLRIERPILRSGKRLRSRQSSNARSRPRFPAPSRA